MGMFTNIFNYKNKQYQWKDIQIVMLGYLIVGIRGIDWEIGQEKQFYYGKGNNPEAIVNNNISYNGNIKVLQNTYETFQSLSPTGNVVSLSSFYIIVVFEQLALDGGMIPKGKLTYLTLKGCEFTSEGIGHSQGNKYAEIELPFMFLNMVKSY